MVIVAAVLTASHDGRPSFRSVASCSIFLNTDWIPGGAGTGPGRECAAFINCLRAGESLDILGQCGGACKSGCSFSQYARWAEWLHLKLDCILKLSNMCRRIVATGAHQLTKVVRVV